MIEFEWASAFHLMCVNDQNFKYIFKEFHVLGTGKILNFSQHLFWI